MQRAERRLADRESRAVRTLAESDYLLGVTDATRLGALRFRSRGEQIFQAPIRAGVPALIELGRLLQLTERILRDEETDEDLQLIFAPGSSLGGARPKVSARPLRSCCPASFVRCFQTDSARSWRPERRNRSIGADRAGDHAHHADPGEVLRPFAQYPDVENGAPHPLAIQHDYVQPLYDPKSGEAFDEARALASGMLGAAIRSARHGGSGILVVSDVTQPDAEGRKPPHWFRSISHTQRSAPTIALTINDRTRWVLDTVSRQPNAFIDEDGERVAPLVKSLAERIAALRQNKLNERLVDLIDKAVVITDDAGLILRTNQRARELLGLKDCEKTQIGNLADFVKGCGLPGLSEPDTTLCMGPRNGRGVETRVKRFEDMTRTSDIIWLLSGADRETYNFDTKYIAETRSQTSKPWRKRTLNPPNSTTPVVCGRSIKIVVTRPTMRCSARWAVP